MVTWESNNQNVKAKDVVGDHWKMEAKLLGVSSRLRKVFDNKFYWLNTFKIEIIPKIPSRWFCS